MDCPCSSDTHAIKFCVSSPEKQSLCRIADLERIDLPKPLGSMIQIRPPIVTGKQKNKDNP